VQRLGGSNQSTSIPQVAHVPTESSFSTRRENQQPVRYYVFLDVETCFESNWPSFGAGDRKNVDTVGNRSVERRSESPCYNIQHCRFMRLAVRTKFFKKAFKNKTTATLVAFECRGDAGPRVQFRKRISKNWPLALVTISSKWEQLRNPPDMEQGLPPVAAKPVELTARQEQDIQECKEDARSFLLTFAGNFRGRARKELIKLHDLKKDVLIARREQLNRFWNGTFEEMLADSKFGAAPRGDNTFSYRFTEVLSAGAIPVVHADGWVLPFRPELVDWTFPKTKSIERWKFWPRLMTRPGAGCGNGVMIFISSTCGRTTEPWRE
jgi:hypothetical protein